MATEPDPLLRIPHLYHFTDTRNLPGITLHGGILSAAKLRARQAEFIPGGNDWSLQQDTRFGMDRYVHLCWAQGHPMEYHIRQRDQSIRLTHLVVDRAILYEPGVRFCPGVANAVGMKTYSIEEARDGNMIDYDAFYGNIGSLREPGPQARRQMAERSEILVPDIVLVKFIKNIPNG